jgi:hypothetical protein
MTILPSSYLSVPEYIQGYCACDGSGFLPPLWYQAAALESTANITILPMGRGAGKSETLWQMMYDTCIDYPFINVLFGAPSHKILKNGIFKTIDLWRRVIEGPIEQGGWGFDPILEFTKSPQDMHLTWIWGSRIDFRSTKDMDDFRGQNIGRAFFDEADYIDATPDQWAAFVPTLRGYGPHSIVAAGTPSTSGTGLMALLLEVAKNDPGSIVVKATTLDNPYFPASTLRLMRATMTPEDWAREVEGRAVARTGLVYPEYCDDNIIDGWDLARELQQEQMNPWLTGIQRWRTFVMLDWGYSMSHALLLAARQLTPDRPPEVVVYRDLPFDRASGEWMAKEVKRWWTLDPIRPTAALCDPEGAISIAAARPFFAADGIPLEYQRNPMFRRVDRTVELLRRLVCTMDGVRSLKLTREVVNLPCNGPGGRGMHQSFKHYALAEVGRGTGIYSGKPFDDNKTTHSLDCARYFPINMGTFGFKWPYRFADENDARAVDLSPRAEKRLS